MDKGGALNTSVTALRRAQLLTLSPKPLFIAAAGVYATLLAGFAFAAAISLFEVARRGSGIPVPRPTPGRILFACVALIALALGGTRYSVPDGYSARTRCW